MQNARYLQSRKMDYQHQLERLRTEQQRRTALTAAQRTHEQQRQQSATQEDGRVEFTDYAPPHQPDIGL